MTYRYQLTCITPTASLDDLLTDLDEAAGLSGLHPEMIEEFLRASLVRGFSGKNGKVYFDQAGIFRLRQIARLLQSEHASLRIIRYIAGLLDSLDARDRELRTLREQLR